MREYFQWLYKFEYFRWPPWQLAVFYFLLAGLVWVLRVYLHIVLFHRNYLQEQKEIESRHGQKVVSFLKKFFMITLSTTIMPVVEKTLCYGPVLWLVLQSKYYYALLVLIISSVIFTLSHIVENYGRYKDGSKLKKTESAIGNAFLGGLFLRDINYFHKFIVASNLSLYNVECISNSLRIILSERI